MIWPSAGLILLLGSWLLTIGARRWNRLDSAWLFCLTLLAAIASAGAGAAALLAGPWLSGLDPTRHVYDATVWLLVLWTVVHVGAGVIMQLYCLARRWARRMTARHDQDIVNVTLYWHFVALTVAVTAAVIAGFPLVA